MTASALRFKATAAPPSTRCRCLTRERGPRSLPGYGSGLEPPEPPNRYGRSRPGELVHVDVKKLGRFRRAGHRVTGSKRGRLTRTTEAGRGRGGVGWEFCHVMVDDATRLAYVEILPDERGETAADYLRRALAWFAAWGQSRAGDERRRLLLPIGGSPCGLPGARPAPSVHAPLPPAHQRQGRALHPDAAQGVGLRAHLRRRGGTTRTAGSVARALQLPAQAWLPRQAPAGSSLKRAGREQPGCELQLGHDAKQAATPDTLCARRGGAPWGALRGGSCSGSTPSPARHTDRADAAADLAKSFGAELQQIYWCLGPYDIVAILEAPDDETVTAFALKLSSAGNVRTATMRAYSRDEMSAIIAKAG